MAAQHGSHCSVRVRSCDSQSQSDFHLGNPCRLGERFRRRGFQQPPFLAGYCCQSLCSKKCIPSRVIYRKKSAFRTECSEISVTVPITGIWIQSSHQLPLLLRIQIVLGLHNNNLVAPNGSFETIDILIYSSPLARASSCQGRRKPTG